MTRRPAAKAQAGPEPLYTVDSYRPEESVGLLLAMVRTQLMAALDGDLADLGLTGAQLPVLHWIRQLEAATAATLCRAIGSDTGSMTRMLDRLEDKGFIRRVRSQADRRVVHLELTAAGKALWPMINPRVVKVLNHFLRGFDQRELEALKGMLRRMLENA